MNPIELMRRPQYFERVRCMAAEGWDRREQSLEDLGVWKILFEQVKDPRHVISELLQNADDAGAISTKVTFEDGVFVFEHDGEDFNEETFRSLCRFGYSNKRTIHTVGFRGIGFKSTFSLGPQVDVRTPTLAVRFNDERFTEPSWLEEVDPADKTRIEIRVEHGSNELGRSLTSWAESPAVLLFLRDVAALEVQGQSLSKERLERGPASRSEWVELRADGTTRVLHVWSEARPFPVRAEEEIRATRRLAGNENLPPCRVDLVLGLGHPQRVHVVLPSGDRNALPFSFNAPFLQKPDRSELRPDSLTNTWLLKRVGRLAARTMLDWLANERLNLDERAAAYALLPASELFGPAEEVASAFWKKLEACQVLLGHDGQLHSTDKCLDLPPELLAVWTPAECLDLFGDGHVAVLAPEVDAASRKRLRRTGLLVECTPVRVLQRLMWGNPVFPSQPNGLVHLWAFAAKHDKQLEPNWRLGRWWHGRDSLRVFPVHGRDRLYAPSVIVAASRWKTLTKDERELLQRNVELMDEDACEIPEVPPDERLPSDGAGQFLKLIHETLEEREGLQAAVEAASQRVFSAKKPGADGVALAVLMSRVDASTPDSFKFMSCDGRWRKPESLEGDKRWTRSWQSCNLIAGTDASDLLPKEWAKEHLLARAYTSKLDTDQQARWIRWVQSKKSRLHTFPVPVWHEFTLYSREEVASTFRSRGVQGPSKYFYKRDNFLLEDFDFDEALWRHWRKCAKNEAEFWPRVVDAVASHWTTSDLDKVLIPKMYHVARVNREQLLPRLPSKWLLVLRETPCLNDDQGAPRRPDELLRRTTQSTPLLGTELFVDEEIDKPKNAALLDALGVRNTPADVLGLLGHIRTISDETEPDPHNLERVRGLYRALDLALGNADESKAKEVWHAFQEEPLIRVEAGGWRRANEVVREGRKEVPEVLQDLRRLTLWDRVGVSASVNEEWAEQVLSGLSSGSSVGDQRSVVRALVRNYPDLAVSKGHWLTLEGCWTPLEELKWVASSPPNLHVGIKRKTADASMCETGVPDGLSSLPTLDDAIEWRAEYEETTAMPTPMWVEPLFGPLASLSAIRGESPHRAVAIEKIREVAGALLETTWVAAMSMSLTPFLERQRIGPAKNAERAHWDRHGRQIVVVGKRTEYKDALVQALREAFDSELVQEWIGECVQRAPDWVEEYLDGRIDCGAEPTVLTGSTAPGEAKANAPVGEELSQEDALEEVDTTKKSGESFLRSAKSQRSRSKSSSRQPGRSSSEARRTASDHGEDEQQTIELNEMAADWAVELKDKKLTRRVELAAMNAVREDEEMRGNTVRDVHKERLGYDLESLTPNGKRRLIEVKGRRLGASTFYVTRNEIGRAVDKPDEWLLALVDVELSGDGSSVVDTKTHYVAQPFEAKPEDGVEGWTCNLDYFRRS